MDGNNSVSKSSKSKRFIPIKDRELEITRLGELVQVLHATRYYLLDNDWVPKQYPYIYEDLMRELNPKLTALMFARNLKLEELEKVKRTNSEGAKKYRREHGLKEDKRKTRAKYKTPTPLKSTKFDQE